MILKCDELHSAMRGYAENSKSKFLLESGHRSKERCALKTKMLLKDQIETTHNQCWVKVVKECLECMWI